MFLGNSPGDATVIKLNIPARRHVTKATVHMTPGRDAFILRNAISFSGRYSRYNW